MKTVNKNSHQQEDRFSTVRYEIRKALGIQINEYCFCDIAYHLAASRRSRTPGWAHAKNHYYSDLLGITERGLRKMKNRMIEARLIERHPEHEDLIRTTDRWELAHLTGKVQPLPEPEKKPNKWAELSSGLRIDPELSSALSGTEFLPPRNLVPPYPELSSANSNRDKDNDKDKDREGGAPAMDSLSIQEFLRKKKLGPASISARREVLQLAMEWMKTKDFQNTWQFLSAGLAGAENVDPGTVLRDFIITGDFQYVADFRINKLRGWIRTAASKTMTNEQPGNDSEGFEYSEASHEF